MKISVLTLGCKVNQAESAALEGILKNSLHSIVDLAEKPDICIVNTCTVTSKSDYQSRQLIRRAQRVGARVIVTGCYSELNKQAVNTMSGVSDVIENKSKIETIKKLIGNDGQTQVSTPSLAKIRSRHFLKVQDGCNYSCSYCTIPKARGVSVSVRPEDVLDEALWAVSAKYSEIVLTGIHLGIYGLDLKPKVKLSSLIATLLNKTKIKRIRLSSLEIREVGDDILELFEDNRICKHLHLPLQSGDDKILKGMRRTYSFSEFSSMLNRICNRVPGTALGTDIIVGFPGEGESEFENTYNALNIRPFSYIHIFPFSARPGTLASKMSDNTPDSVKKDRSRKLELLNKKKKKDFLSLQLGQILDVLIEEVYDDGTCFGTSGNYLKVRLPSNNCSRGLIVDARAERIEEGILIGSPI